MQDLYSKLKKSSFDEKFFTGVAFVSFNTVKEVNEYCKLFPETFLEYLYFYLKQLFYSVKVSDESSGKVKNKKKLIFRVVKASEPSDINWENLEYSSFNRLLRYVVIYFFTLILIGIGFIIILSVDQLHPDSEKEPLKSTAISILISIIISVINFIIPKVLKEFNE